MKGVTDATHTSTPRAPSGARSEGPENRRFWSGCISMPRVSTLGPGAIGWRSPPTETSSLCDAGQSGTDAGLEFENLSERYEFVQPNSTAYRTAWSLYDNAAASARQALGSPEAHQTTGSRLPEPDRYLGDRNLLLQAEITSTHADHPVWEQPVRVYLRSTGSSYEVVGIERDSLRAYVPMQ